MDTPFDSFCAQVCRYVGWKRVHVSITQEFTGHLEDAAAALAARGLGPEEAAVQAVAAMGDPADIGRALDRVHRPFWHYVARALLWLGGCALAAALVVGYLDRGHPLPLLARDSAAETAATWGGPNYGTVSALLRRGRVTGGGRMGDYTLTPTGEAVVVDLDLSQSALFDQPWAELRIPVTTTHAQPWLDSLDPSRLRIQARDDLGGQLKTAPMSVRPLSSSALESTWFLALLAPDPAAGQVTVTATAPDGQQIRFTVTLEEVSP